MSKKKRTNKKELLILVTEITSMITAIINLIVVISKFFDK